MKQNKFCFYKNDTPKIQPKSQHIFEKKTLTFL